MTEEFHFGSFDLLAGSEIDLNLAKNEPADPVKGHVPAYDFDIALHGTAEKVGSLRLRIGTAEQLFFPGHLGYDVAGPFRGRHYAEAACRLVTPVPLFHNLHALILTCSPDNIPSKRTIENLGARLLGEVAVPPTHEMYAEHGPLLLRYEWAL